MLFFIITELKEPSKYPYEFCGDDYTYFGDGDFRS